MRAQDWNGEMPLHFAALNEDVPIVKQLLLAGADPLAPDAVLDTVLLWAYAAGTNPALTDGWRNMSFMFLLNWQALSDHDGCHNLKQLCRSLCHMAVLMPLGRRVPTGGDLMDQYQAAVVRRGGLRAR